MSVAKTDFFFGISIAMTKTMKDCTDLDRRRKVALDAKAKHNNACDKLDIIGITGTNGKTTTAHIIVHILSSCGIKTAMIGTLGIVVGGEKNFISPSKLTTPDPTDLHEAFARMVKMGVRAVVMECSAHAIYLEKLAGINFRQKIFTNLSMDHLDFFGDYRTYADVKINWFDGAKNSIINIDDAESETIVQNQSVGASVARPKGLHTYSLQDATEIEMHTTHSKFTLKNTKIECGTRFFVPLAGEFNIYNTLAAINSAREMGLGDDEIATALKTLPPVPGRFNSVDVNGVTVIIDYAHTPDSLEKILQTARGLSQGKLITVFGCGGNRDVGKRPLMGRIAGRLSDFTVITSDNPRTEPSRSIMLQIRAGVKLESRNYLLIQERCDAIFFALHKANRGDIVVIAGKGAEEYIEIDNKRIPYSDATVVHEFQKLMQNSTKKDTN